MSAVFLLDQVLACTEFLLSWDIGFFFVVVLLCRHTASPPKYSRIANVLVLSFFLCFIRPNLITGLSGWRAPDQPLRLGPKNLTRTGGPEHYRSHTFFFLSFLGFEDPT